MPETLQDVSVDDTPPEAETAEAEDKPDSFFNSGCLRGERRGSRIRIFKVNDTCTCELNLADMDTGSAKKVYPILAALSKDS